MSPSLAPPEFPIGSIRLRRIIEMETPFKTPFELFPQDATAVAVDAHRPALEPWAMDPSSGRMIFAFQSYLARTPRSTILIDACIGCDKTISGYPEWHQRQDRVWLDRLARAGVAPEQVDFVLCTHLHSDHCGWNTLLKDGRWVPTFPNATYLMTREDVEMVKGRPTATYAENVLPVIEAGQAQIVDTDFAFDDEIWIERTPGHTPGHCAVHFRSQGVEAVMVGDAIHTPLQCAHPDWRFFSDSDADQAVLTRRALLEAHCDTGRLVMPAHFPSPSCGHVVRDGAHFGFNFKNGC